jgi:iron complex transport system ATP-binding protein
MAALLSVNNLKVQYGDLTIVENVSFSVEPGMWLMLVGPNGAGKSTIVNAVAQNVPYEGTVLLNGEDATALRPKERAKIMGVLSQQHYVAYDYTVEEVVCLGRYAHRGGLFDRSDKDADEAVRSALLRSGLLDKKDQSVLTLSGGELQRTFLAQLLAQAPRLFVLDEPTSYLDLLYQREVLELLRCWLKEENGAIVSVVHDLTVALAYGTDALLLDRGNVCGLGPVADILTREHLFSVYGLDVVADGIERHARWLSVAEK